MERPLPDKISIVMRSFNEAWALQGTLKAIFEQDFSGEIEVIAIDSGSTDQSIEIFHAYPQVLLDVISPGSYVPGVVLNQGIRQSTSDWVICLNADATPVGKNWLSNLLYSGLAAENPGTFFSRQIPREDCKAVFAHDYDRCFGPNRESLKWPHFFSMVSCLVYKPAWEKEPIREDLQYAEDNEWSKRLKAVGYGVDFVPDSVVMHSHNYTLQQSFKRAFGDAKAMAYAEGPAAPRFRNLVCKGFAKDAFLDTRYFMKTATLPQLPHALGVRFAQRLGRYKGVLAGLQQRAIDQLSLNKN